MALIFKPIYYGVKMLGPTQWRFSEVVSSFVAAKVNGTM